MHILITGSAGSIGRNLLTLLSSEEFIDDDPITEVTLADIVDTHVELSVTSFVINKKIIDIAGDGPSSVEELFDGRPDFIFHLAGVDADAEVDFERGYRVNVDGTKNLLDAIRGIPGYCPRFVFASSISAPDQCPTEPQGPSEIQKAIAELLVTDCSRKGIVDGISVRLPTSFFSSIIRESLSGYETICPVPPSYCHIVASPEAVAGNLLHAANLSSRQIANARIVNMPGVAVTVYEIIEAISNVTEKNVVKLVPQGSNDNKRRSLHMSNIFKTNDESLALSLGFYPDESIDTIVRSYTDDYLRHSKRCQRRQLLRLQFSGITA